MAVTDVIYDKGGMVFNVKAYGALGTALANPAQDDTAAFQAAITAASLVMGTASQTATSARGSVVYVPHGVYRIKSTLHLPNGVAIKGAGIRTTQLIFQVAAGQNGLMWDTGTESPFRVGGFLEDIDLKNDSGVQDLVVLDTWAAFAINRARLYGAGRYNLRMNDGIDFTAVHMESMASTTSALYIDATRDVTTTCRFVSCYFQGTLAGPCVDVEGLGLVFDGCVFESSGESNQELGIGARVRWGTVTFIAPYFENNSKWEIISGTEDRPIGANRDTSVTVINPLMRFGQNADKSFRKLATGGGFRFERGSAFVIGGDFAGMQRPIVITPATGNVFITANTYPYTPVMEGGSGSLKSAAGTIIYTDPATGQIIQTGAVGHEIGGGTLITRHISVTPPDWATGVVPQGAIATITVPVTGAALGDTVVVGARHLGGALPAGLLFFGAASTNQVIVTMLNETGGTLNNLVAQMRVDVWKH